MNELERAIMTSSCADCAGIPKVAEAGRILDTPRGPVQIVRYGVRVRAGGYHVDWMAQGIRALRGHHEPQDRDRPAALLELGASILAEHDIQQSYSGDGLVIASFFSGDRWISLPSTSRNGPHRSLFPEP